MKRAMKESFVTMVLIQIQPHQLVTIRIDVDGNQSRTTMKLVDEFFFA